MALHIRKNDMVEVIAGDHRGARGKVLRIDPKRHKVVVEGVNMVFRHVKPSRKNPRGGRLQKEAPLHISNVLPYDPAAGKGRRIRFEIEGDRRGRSAVKKRVTVGGTTLHTLSKARRTEG